MLFRNLVISFTIFFLLSGFKGPEDKEAILDIIVDEGQDEADEGEGHNHDAASEKAETVGPVDLSNFDTGKPTGTVKAFHASLKNGDAKAARGFLADDILIYESGNTEGSADEYASHHMISDMAFVGAMNQEILSQVEKTVGDMAMVASETRTFGTFNGKDYNLQGTETMILKRTGGIWKITHIHWSSHPVTE